MADLYGLGLSGVPLEYSSQIRALQQQQMMANSLLQQAQDPVQNSGPPGSSISPTQGLAKMVQAYVGAKAMQKMNQGYADIGNKFNADQSAAVDKVSKAIAPAPATPIPLANANGIEGQMIPRTPQEKQAAVQEAMLSQFPNVRQFGTALNNNIQGEITREDNQQFRMDTLKSQQEQRMHERELAIEERKRQEVIQAEVRRQQFEQQQELKKMVASGAGQSPYFQPVQTGQGVFAFNARTGTVEPVAGPDGKPIVGAVADANLQGQIAGAKTSGKERAEATVKAEVGLPQAIDTGNMALKQVDDLIEHPGFSSTVGATLKPGARFVDGTHEADFMKRLDQLKGGAFLQAFESLKGGGQITEVEGKKATDAITRMDKAQSEKEFINAAREFQGVIRNGVSRAKQKAGGTSKPAASVESLLEKYK